MVTDHAPLFDTWVFAKLLMTFILALGSRAVVLNSKSCSCAAVCPLPFPLSLLALVCIMIMIMTIYKEHFLFLLIQMCFTYKSEWKEAWPQHREFTCPTLYEYCVGSFTSHWFFRCELWWVWRWGAPFIVLIYLRRLESLTIHRCNNKGSTLCNM